MKPSRHILLTTSLLVAAAFGLAGCNGKVSTANDELRARVLDLEKENEQLRRRETELRAELERESQRPDSAPAAVRENTPHVADITIGRLSHAVDTDDDGRPDRLILYVNPVDGMGRFVQMVGSLSAHAMYVPADADAATIGRITLEPGDLRQAYRSSVTGTHYTIELLVAIDEGQALESCLAHIRFEDGLTGAVHTAEREIDLRR